EHPKLGVYVKGLYLMPCATKQDVMSNLEYGLKMRTIAATNMNQSSSRSHAVFTITVNKLEGERPKGRNDKDERKSLHAKINLIDLAGSERTSKAQTENERLKEGCAINQSLSQLGLVIKMLTEQSSGGLKAPMFRASKLTFLLKDSLAGNSKTCCFAAEVLDSLGPRHVKRRISSPTLGMIKRSPPINRHSSSYRVPIVRT
ncbi:Kif14, partial [Symbiodinium pilosum]